MSRNQSTNDYKNKQNEIINDDVNIKGDINIYVCGNINTFLNCEDGFNFTASRNYYVLEQIFEKKYTTKSGNIQLDKNAQIYYNYELRKKEKDNKLYNAFLFFNKADEEFFEMLFNHIFEIDKTNKNKNVVLFFGDENDIIKSVDKLNNKSEETVPILLIVNDSRYDDKLKFVNYIPDLNAIKKFLKTKKEKLPEDQIPAFCESVLVNYINTKLLRIDMYYNQLGYNLNMINPMNETYLRIKEYLTVALVGSSGCGKSTLVNLIFNELVARISPSIKDVTSKCSEYYLPIKETKEENIGQIRFLDFPGITENSNYNKIVEPEIKRKLKEYKTNMEQIDLAIYFVPDGSIREFTDAGIKLINLLNDNHIKIIFVINGALNDFKLKQKKQKMKNNITNNEILKNDCSNVVNSDFYQTFKDANKTGISKIFEKIIEEIKIKDEKFRVEDINIKNYDKKLIQLSKSSRIFEQYNCIKAIKENSRSKANWTVAGYSALALGSSALSLIVPVVDCALSYGYQVAMVYSIFSIYELKPKDYNIINIILSGGKTVEEKIKNKITKTTKTLGKKDDKDNNKKNDKNIDEVKKGIIKETIKDVTHGAKIAGQIGIQNVAKKEAGKVIVEKTVQTVVADTIEAAAIKTTANTMEAIMVNTVEHTVTQTVEKLAIESTKQLAESGLKEGSKIMVNVAKDAVVAVAAEGGEELIITGTKETVKTITETIIVQQGGKAWLINLGKAVPFIGAALSAVMNTYSTAALGKRLVDKLDKDFDNNQQRQVDIIKGRIYGLYNIIKQMKAIIQEVNNNN